MQRPLKKKDGRPPGLAARAALLFGLAAYLSAATDVTPVQKVIELLNGMVNKGKEEMHQEKVAFAAYGEFCRGSEESKVKAIKTAESSISALQDKIGTAEVNVERLGEEIDGLNADIDGWNAEKAKSKKVRQTERTDYEESLASYEDAIDALERAIKVLKERSAHTKGVSKKGEEPAVAAAAKLLQEVGQRATANGPSSRLAMLGRSLQASLMEVSDNKAAPEANAYEFQSKSIVETLENMRLKFQDEKNVLEKEEMNRRHAFELVMETLTDDVKYAEEETSRKTEQRGEEQAALAAAKGDLEETQTAKAADEKYLADLRANCKTKSVEFDQRQKLRQEELDALAKAIEIISSPKVSGAAEVHLPAALAQSSFRGMQLLQLRGADEAPGATSQERAAAFLTKQAGSMKSSMLASIAARAAKDPFVKVRQLIKDLLARLIEEANQEADHHEWCQKEVSANKASREELSSQVEELTAKVDELDALEKTLETEIGELKEQIADLDDSVKKAVKEREEEKAENEATIADSKGAQAAVVEATKILKEFYGRASTATSLLERRRQAPFEEPATWDSPYQGLSGESKGVLGMLDVIHSDFARLEAETTVAEGDAARRHKQFMEDSAVDRAVKDKEMRHKGFKRDSTLRLLRESKKELEETQVELTDAMKYYDKLKPACIDLGLSYKERVEKRQQEIQSLKEALRILNGEDLP